MTHTTKLLAGVLALGMFAAACGGDDGGDGHVAATASTAATPVIDPGDGGTYAPVLDPTDFVDRIDNPYLPFLPGTSWTFEGVSSGKPEHIEVVVTPERKEILGISAVVVRDTVTVDGEVVEDTFDWFAQDRDGNVWYLGEAVQDFENGKLVGTDGTWEAGVDGAVAGIVMPATPAVGDAYRQEFSIGEAEDMFEIIADDDTETVPAGQFARVVVTKDWNPLEPDVIEEKRYAPGVGLIAERKIAGDRGRAELVRFTPGS